MGVWEASVRYKNYFCTLLSQRISILWGMGELLVQFPHFSFLWGSSKVLGLSAAVSTVLIKCISTFSWIAFAPMWSWSLCTKHFGTIAACAGDKVHWGLIPWCCSLPPTLPEWQVPLPPHPPSPATRSVLKEVVSVSVPCWGTGFYPIWGAAGSSLSPK